MRIAFLSPEYPPTWGGVGAHTYYLSASLARLGHEMTVITRHQPVPGSPPPNPGVRLLYLKPLRFPSLSALFFGRKAAGLLREMGCPFDIVHMMSPLIALRRPWFAWISCPLVTTMHGTWFGERQALQHKTGAKGLNDLAIRYLSPYFEKYEKLALEKSALVLTVSRYCVHELVEHYGAAPQTVQVLPNGVDTSRFVPVPASRAYLLEKYGIAPEAGLILFVGRFAARKGLGFLLEAFRHLLRQRGGNARLLLTGDGPLRRYLIDRARTLGIGDKIVFTGKLDIEALVRHYAGATAFVLPSSYEGQGMVLLEAMACGCPCIATNVAAIPELVIPNETGTLVNYGDVEALSASLHRALTDRATHQRLAKNARERMLRDYDWLHLAEKLTGFYQRIRHGDRDSHAEAQRFHPISSR